MFLCSVFVYGRSSNNIVSGGQLITTIVTDDLFQLVLALYFNKMKVENFYAVGDSVLSGVLHAVVWA
jgi:hypothetical protein